MSILIEDNVRLQSVKLNELKYGDVIRTQMNHMSFVKLGGGYLQITNKFGDALDLPIVATEEQVLEQDEYFHKLDQTVTIEI